MCGFKTTFKVSNILNRFLTHHYCNLGVGIGIRRRNACYLPNAIHLPYILKHFKVSVNEMLCVFPHESYKKHASQLASCSSF